MKEMHWMVTLGGGVRGGAGEGGLGSILIVSVFPQSEQYQSIGSYPSNLQESAKFDIPYAF